MTFHFEDAHVVHVLETIPDAVLIVDRNGIVRFANTQALELFGFELVLIGQPVETLLPGDSTSRGAELNLIARRKDGSQIPADVHVGQHDGGDDQYLIYTIRDATRQRETDLMLRRQHMHLEMLYFATQVANDADSAENAIRTVVDYVCEHLAFDVGHAYVSTVADEARSVSVTRTWYLSDPARFLAFREASEQISFRTGLGLPGKVMDTGDPIWVEDVLARDDYIRQDVARQVGLRTGVFIPLRVEQQVAAVLECYTTRVLPRDDELFGVLSQIGTILGRAVERKLARERYQHEAEDRRQVLEAVGDGILIVDPTGEITFANQQALEYFEHAPSDLIGANVGDVPRWPVKKHFGTFPETGHPVIRALQRGEPVFDVEVQVHRPRSGPIDLSINVAPIRSPDGTIASAVLSLRDITDRKRAEQLLRGQQQVLARVVEGASMNEVGRALTEMITAHLPVAGVMLFAWDANRENLDLLAASEIPESVQQVLSPGSFQDSGLPCISVVENGEARYVHFSRTPPAEAIAEIVDEIGIKSCWAFPIQSGSGRPLGVFCMYLTTEREPAGGDTEIINTAVGLSQISFERILFERKLASQAFYDQLTGLPNRVLLMDRIEHALRRSQRTDEPVALLFLDLDEFKAVNDQLGHHAGDELLITTARRLEQLVRSEDTVARFAGDEFVVLIEAVDKRQDVMDIAERIQHSFDEPIIIAGQEIRVTCSIGIAFNDDSETDADGLLRAADQAMYRAKFEGRLNRTSRF